MQVITAIEEMRRYSRNIRGEGKTLGFVPTMGYLHDGHMSLVDAARKECDIVAVSVFVNPVQFGPGEDLDRYPRDIERDRHISEEHGVDVMFIPSEEEMYPDGYSTFVEPTGVIVRGLCGLSKPGHFRGVATVVAKFLNITKPHVIYFGQKDAQQSVVIKRMVEDLNMDTEVRVMPIVREADGLAMSSRNSCLSPEERGQAPGLFRSLKRAEDLVAGGEYSADKIRTEMENMMRETPDLRIDYIEIVDAHGLMPLDRVKENTLIAVAARVGRTRLIDNIRIGKTRESEG